MTPAITPPLLVIGASTGGVDALKTIVSGLPAAFPAAVLVVLHRSEAFPDHLPQILGQAGALPAVAAIHGERIEPSRIYVAPPDNHLLVRGDHVEVVRGPRENGSRPAVNPLFRTAAAAHGSRVIGVVLTGHLDCGTLGLLAIKATGGATVAQDPAGAECGEMPLNAIQSGAVDEILPLPSMAARLVELVGQKRVAEPPAVTQQAPRLYSFITCPHCHGSMTEQGTEANPEFKCHVGHRFSLRSLYAGQADEIESALWAARRALEEGAAVAKRLADAATGSLQARFEEKERAMKGYARTITEILLSSAAGSPMDVMSPPDLENNAR